MPLAMTSRAGRLFAAVVVMALGMASRQPQLALPKFIATYAGDTLWALLVLLGIGVLWPVMPLWRRAALAWLFACAIEFSQCFHAPWIDAVRATALGGLVLGYDFVWSDIVCYSVGIALGAAMEALLSALRRAPAAAP